jgi:hypothetical protein
MTRWALPALTNVQLRLGVFPLNPRGYPSMPARSGPYLARDLLLRLSAIRPITICDRLDTAEALHRARAQGARGRPTGFQMGASWD